MSWSIQFRFSALHGERADGTPLSIHRAGPRLFSVLPLSTALLFALLSPGCVLQETNLGNQDGDAYPLAVDCDDLDAEIGSRYPDLDRDGHGSGGPRDGCHAATWASVGGDCDDEDEAIFPGAMELCDGKDNDCDEANEAIFSGAMELCDGKDNDCDGAVDEDAEPDAWYRDADGDGYGDPAVVALVCGMGVSVEGFVENGLDCYDGAEAVFPGALEVCNGIDDDCDGERDEGFDGDGYGVASSITRACTEPSGYASVGGDCDDGNAAVNPGAAEVCDGIDNECNGANDDGVTSTWYLDADGDGYGSSGSTTLACTQPAGYVGNSSDCDDGNAAVNPAATEVCNGRDNDCDADIDDADPSITGQTIGYADGDGYGDPQAPYTSCTWVTGNVYNGLDCDDQRPDLSPDEIEIPDDGLDNDCDGTPDWDILVMPDCTDAGNQTPCHTSIQDAIAASSLGDLIAVRPVTYRETLDFRGMGISVLGSHGPELTVIDAGGAGSGVRFVSGEASSSRLSGFTVTGGIGSLADVCGLVSGRTHGGGICIDAAAPTLDNLRLQGNSAAFGGGILLINGASPSLEDLEIVSNDATEHGGGLSAYDASLNASGLVLEGNTAKRGGGLYLFSSQGTLSHFVVAANTASEDGGGLYINDSTTRLTQGRIQANEAQDLVSFCAGGGVTLHESSPTWDHLEVSDNEAIKGGGICIEGPASPTLSWLLLQSNDSSGPGGGMFVYNATPTLVQAVITDNRASGSGGGIRLEQSSALTLTRSILAFNSGSSTLSAFTGTSVAASYNDFFVTEGVAGTSGSVGGIGNLNIDPGFVDDARDGSAMDDDYHLRSDSGLIDQGDPTTAFNDADGSANDPGLYGGPEGEIWAVEGR